MTSLFNLRLISLLATSIFCHNVYANCTVTSTTAPASVLLGTHNTKVVSTGGITSGQVFFWVECTVTLELNLLGDASSTLSYTANNPMVLTHATVPSEQIGYQIASNTTFTPTITNQGGSIGGGSFSLLSLTLLQSKNIRVPVYVRTGTTSRWPRSGTYNSHQSLHVTGSICTLSVLNACLTAYPVTNTVTMPIQLEVSKLCEFIEVSTDVSFGGHAFMDHVAPQTLTARVQCTHGDTFKIYASLGAHHNGNHRQMNGPGQQKIAYDIYHPSSTTNTLTQANGYSKAGTGLPDDIVFPVRVIAGQTTPAIGNYQDTVRLVIEY